MIQEKKVQHSYFRKRNCYVYLKSFLLISMDHQMSVTKIFLV